jgi:hypothetical protein
MDRAHTKNIIAVDWWPKLYEKIFSADYQLGAKIFSANYQLGANRTSLNGGGVKVKLVGRKSILESYKSSQFTTPHKLTRDVFGLTNTLDGDGDGDDSP